MYIGACFHNVCFRTKLKEDSLEHGKLVSAMTKERLTLEEKINELNKTLEEVSEKECELSYTFLEYGHG